jgi:hypothetical protein
MAQPAAVPLVPAPRQPPTGLDRTGRPRFSTCCADSRRSFAKLRHGVQPRKRSAGFGGGLDDERARYRGERERPRDKAESFRGERKRGTRAAEATAEQVRERRKFSVDGRNLRAWVRRAGRSQGR